MVGTILIHQLSRIVTSSRYSHFWLENTAAQLSETKPIGAILHFGTSVSRIRYTRGVLEIKSQPLIFRYDLRQEDI